MKKQYFAMVLFAVLASLALVTQTVSAQSSGGSNSIWSGLWSGVNFDLSGLGGQSRTTTTTTKPAPAPKATAPVTTKQTYAALGDSVAAGLGLPIYANAGPGTAQCGRSAQSYATTVAASTNKTLMHGACSGATVGDLFTKQGVSGPNIPAQLDYAYAKGTPSLISITAGANDAHWDEFIRGCYATRCANGVTTGLANGYLIALEAKLHLAFTSISARSNGTPPTVVVTGYYNPLSPACTQYQSNITADEINWLAAETAALNQTIQNAGAQYSFVRFAPVDFTGHDICSGDSWVQGLTDAAPFHPTAAGQQAIARSILSAISQ